MASSVRKFLYHPAIQNAVKVTAWFDNCPGQGKNWTFFCALVTEVNNHPTLEYITIKYFEKGHTFMSADSFHHEVEKAMRKKKKLFDFEDFSACVSVQGTAVEMKAEDFIDYKNRLSRPPSKDVNYPYLKDVSVAEFRYGSTKLFWKTSHSDPEFKSGQFIKMKYRNAVKANIGDDKKPGLRGVTSSKLSDIIEKIGPVPENKMHFWETIPSNESSKDLTYNYDHLHHKEKEPVPETGGRRGRRRPCTLQIKKQSSSLEPK